MHFNDTLIGIEVDVLFFINNNIKDDVKVEDGEIIDSVHNRYIEYKYKDLVNNPFKHGLKEKDLHLTGINNQITGLQIIAINYLKNIDTIEEELMKLQTKLKCIETQKIIAGKSYY